MPKKQIAKKETYTPLSHKLKVRLFGYCPTCQSYVKPCRNTNMCSLYSISRLM